MPAPRTSLYRCATASTGRIAPRTSLNFIGILLTGLRAGGPAPTNAAPSSLMAAPRRVRRAVQEARLRRCVYAPSINRATISGSPVPRCSAGQFARTSLSRRLHHASGSCEPALRCGGGSLKVLSRSSSRGLRRAVGQPSPRPTMPGRSTLSGSRRVAAPRARPCSTTWRGSSVRRRPKPPSLAWRRARCCFAATTPAGTSSLRFRVKVRASGHWRPLRVKRSPTPLPSSSRCG
jgi:hypothetical protein